jgi:hypothetical protein
MGTRIYGCSDDLVVLEGDITDEICCCDKDVYLAFTDGTMMSVKYSDGGIWKIDIKNAGTPIDRYEPCFDADAEIYSDQVWMKDGLKIVMSAIEAEIIR